MDITKIQLELEQIGFTKSEIKIYLALLKLGSSTTGPIITESKTANSKIYEVLEKLIEKGLSKEDFDATKNFLLKYVNIMVANQNRQLGYALDSKYYNVGELSIRNVRTYIQAVTLVGVRSPNSTFYHPWTPQIKI